MTLAQHRIAWLLVAPAAALVILFHLVPVILTFAATVDTANPTGAYGKFFSSGFRTAVLWRTVQIATITTAVSLILGFITAYVVARRSGWLRSAMIIAAVFPLLTGVVVRSFAWMVMLGKNGIVNTSLMATGMIDQPLPLLYSQGAVIVGLVYLFVPLMILTLVGVLEGIPDDLVQASASLGATPASTFRRVVLPLAVPGLIVGSVLVFTGSFTAYATPQLLGGERQTVMATLMYQRAMTAFDWVGASTIAAIMVAVTLVTVFALSRLARRLNPAAI